MDIKSVIRACCVLLCVVGRGSVAAPLPQFTDTDFEPSSKETVQSKKSFQRSLSGLYSIESWQEPAITQPYSEFGMLYTAATHAQTELDALIKEISLVTQTQAIIPGVKSEARAQKKVATELQGDASRITDLARGSIVADDIPSLVQAFELMNKEVTVVAVKNRFKKPTASGYRDLKMLVQLPETNIIAEVQLHLKGISDIKNGAEHEIYEKIQKIERKGLEQERELSEFELAQIKQLRSESQELYQDAWQQYLQPETVAI
ncbi:phosphoribosylglycinamide formyltransferase [Photobacterium swingsii]|uniref:Phosphoribosylglycinamide formyltransferase n=1 Tax=Photobacterium swingsii TaxID=680026 RepID=A0A0J8VD21_9GAMM|nr:phosphoribosylglycinamide formyltransferase [Photobacterium swingsii]KMV31383.1 phosphoribosylglycinamide formyltransferase [Photobacterium swingsii]PSW25116.1 phosphoribosylglycinamide formyltransferase [Photobacterium swingsii]